MISWNTVAESPDPDSPSFLVEVLAQGEKTFVPNGLRFPSIESAEAYAHDLTSRWFAVTAWRIAGSSDAPNRQ